jgi:hypothetical protein
VISLSQIRLPDAAPLNSAPTEFSSARAMRVLKMMARTPHPTGSSELEQVRSIIVNELSKLGLAPRIQETPAVKNIVVRIAGRDNSAAIVLVAHYDSVKAGPGAADDSSAVAMLIEVARAIGTGSPLKNNVILLFTDGEENGLVGAKAFVYQDPWAKEAGLVMNFDARGTGGPVLMFETSDQNAWMLDEFARACPHPFANSLMPELYRLLPNDTDFTVFKNSGFPGLNFAFVAGDVYYHTRFDSPENFDERTLQQEGSSALALCRRFGALNLRSVGAGREDYFNLFGCWFARYGRRWSRRLSCVAVMLLIFLVIVGFRRGRLEWNAIGFGFIQVLASTVTASIAAMAVGAAAPLLSGSGSLSAQDRTTRTDLYIVGLILLTLAVSASSHALFSRENALESQTVGGLLWWIILMLLSSLFLPGGSYLATWPFLFALMAVAYMIAAKRDEAFNYARPWVLLACSAPAILLLAPMIYVIFLGLTLKLSAVVVAFVALSLGLFVPHMGLVASAARNRWLLPAASAAVSAALILISVRP